MVNAAYKKEFLEILCDLAQKLKTERNEGTTSSTCKTQSSTPHIVKVKVKSRSVVSDSLRPHGL